MAWDIQLYETSGGQTVVEDFIRSLQPATQAKLLRQLNMLEEFGPMLSMPHAKPIGNGLYELRVRGKQEIRIFHIFAKNSTIYLLHGFLKKTQAIPHKELRLADKRKIEIEKL